jgi:hypothetical protein
MFGLSSLLSGLGAKIALGAILTALALGALLYVQTLRLTIERQAGEIIRTTAERDQEKATAEANRRAALALAASQRAAAEDRIALAEQLRQARGRVQIITREVLRDPSASDPLPGAFSPLLRRVRPGP